MEKPDLESLGEITTRLNCSQCGGELHPDEGQVFLTCPYCAAAVYLDRSRVVFHWYIAPTLDERQATAALNRWMSGSQTVKDLDKKARVTGRTFQFFPLWYFRWQTAQGEQVALQPAAATSVSELAHLSLPAGDLKRYDESLVGQAISPTVPLEAAVDWLENKTALSAHNAPGSGRVTEIKEVAIVHVPLYFFQYAFGKNIYTAVVDAASGTVLANLYPPKVETHYRLVGTVTGLVFLCLATFPLVGGATGGQAGAGLGLAACAGLGVVISPFLFAWAFWVASKV